MTDQSTERLIVVPYHPGEAMRRRVATVTGVVVAGLFGASLTWFLLSAEVRGMRTASLEHEEQLQEANSRAAESSRALTALKQDTAIHQATVTEARHIIEELELQVRQLRKDNAFYKGIMAPSGKSVGLQIRRLDISPGPGPRQYRYKLVLTQVGDNRNYLGGVVAVNLIGEREGEQEVLPLRDVSDIKELGMKFRFRYFQNFEGDFSLPEGFAPKQLQVVAQSRGQKATKQERIFNWEGAK